MRPKATERYQQESSNAFLHAKLFGLPLIEVSLFSRIQHDFNFPVNHSATARFVDIFSGAMNFGKRARADPILECNSASADAINIATRYGSFLQINLSRELHCFCAQLKGESEKMLLRFPLQNDFIF